MRIMKSSGAIPTKPRKAGMATFRDLEMGCRVFPTERIPIARMLDSKEEKHIIRKKEN